MEKTYAELKISQQSATELAKVLDKQFGFIQTETLENKPTQKAYYSGMLAATEYFFR